MLFDKLHHHLSSNADGNLKKSAVAAAGGAGTGSSSNTNAADPPVKPVKGSAETKEYVYFSSRSGHRKTKVKKECALPSPPPAPPAAGSHVSDAEASRRQSTVASLVHVAHSTLPGRKRNNSNQGSVGNSTINSTVWGSTSSAAASTAATVVGNAGDSATDNADDDAYSNAATATNGSFARLSIADQNVASNKSEWWDQLKISETVTPDFIHSKLGDNEKLRSEVDFGDGLTSTTYMEWIIHHAKKFFLILVDLGIPEQIFNVIDNSLDDNDLPIAADAVKRLKLHHPKLPKEAFEWKFLKTQGQYHLRFIHQGTHVDYEDDELVPLNVVPQKILHKPQVLVHHDDRITRPRHPNKVFARKRFALGDQPGTLRPEYFLEEIEEMRGVVHDHIVRLYASYTHQGFGYFLLTPCAEMTLRTFLSSPPSAFKKLAEDVRRFKLMDWMHCLADALAYLYDRGIPHRDIRPKSVVVDERTGRILFADIGNFRHLDQTAKSSQSDSEYYIYAAPELWQRSVQLNLSKAPTGLGFGGSRTGRRRSDAGSAPAPASPLTPHPPKTPKTPISPNGGEKNFFDGAVPDGVQISTRGSSRHIVKVGEWVSRPAAKSDVFSLGCIFLDMLTFHSKKKSMSQFVSYRSKQNRAAGSRGGGQPDSSFHANLERVADWIKKLKKEAVDRDDDAVQSALMVCGLILQRDPEARPTPREVCDGLVRVMKLVRKPHCELTNLSAGGAGQGDDAVSMGSWSNWTGWDDMHEYGRSLRAESFNPGTPRNISRAYSFSSSSSGTASSALNINNSNISNNPSEGQLSRAHSQHSRATFGVGESSQPVAAAPPPPPPSSSTKPSMSSLQMHALRGSLATDIPVSPRGTFGDVSSLSPRSTRPPSTSQRSHRSKRTNSPHTLHGHHPHHPASSTTAPTTTGLSRYDDWRYDEQPRNSYRDSDHRLREVRENSREDRPPSPESALLDRSGSELDSD